MLSKTTLQEIVHKAGSSLFTAVERIDLHTPVESQYPEIFADTYLAECEIKWNESGYLAIARFASYPEIQLHLRTDIFSFQPFIFTVKQGRRGVDFYGVFEYFPGHILFVEEVDGPDEPGYTGTFGAYALIHSTFEFSARLLWLWQYYLSSKEMEMPI